MRILQLLKQGDFFLRKKKKDLYQVNESDVGALTHDYVANSYSTLRCYQACNRDVRGSTYAHIFSHASKKLT